MREDRESGSSRGWAVRPVLVLLSTAFLSTAFSSAAFLAVPATSQEDPAAATARGVAPDDDVVVEERITVTATGETTSASELPVSVTVIDREEIERSQEETVVDLVRRVPGIHVVRGGDRGDTASFFVRGAESDQVLALFDGVRLNSPYFAGYDFSQLSSAGIERVEVVRGPFSALWGADAIGGVVNVIPVRGRDGTRLTVLGEAGDDEWQRLEGTFGWGGEGADVFASAYDRDGEGRLENSDFTNRQLLFDAGYTWTAGNRVAVLYQDLDAELGIPFSTPGDFTPNRRQDGAQELLAAPMKFQPTVRWNLELTPSRVERELLFRDPDEPGGFTASDTVADTLQVRLASHHDLGERRRHGLSWGGEWREDQVDAITSFGIDLADDVTRLRAVFVQDVWRASDRVTMIAGVRWDDADPWGGEVSPKVSVGVEIADGVELRGSYGEAFRQPSVGELFFPFSGNPQLEPERSRSAEAGVAVRGKRQRLDAAIFATDTEDLIDFDLATFTFANVEEVEIRGAELSWTIPVGRALDSTLTATWLDTQDQDGLSLLRRPEWSSSWTLSGRIGERLRGDVAAFFVGARAEVDGSTFARKQVGGYTTGNLALAYEVLDGLEITARVHNLADRDYEEVDGYPAPGRRFLGGIRWSR